MTDAEGERLQKVLARVGVGSRRAVEDLIRAGRVEVNGRRAELGQRVDPSRDAVVVDGVPVKLSTEFVYLALHKPVGVVTSMRDTHGRPTVAQLVPPEPRVVPVGRLDRDTSGLLLMTNDGDFAQSVAHPRYGIPKTYVAEVRGRIDRLPARALTRGIELDDGPARADRVRVRASSRGRGIVEIVVREGRNRMVRRMFETVGFDVASLVRTSIGPVRLGRLPVGEWRDLKRSEITELQRPPEVDA